MDLTYGDIQNILKIIDAAEHLEEIEIVHGEFRLHVVRNGSAGGSQKPARVIALDPSPAEGASPAEKAAPSQPASAARPAEIAVPEGVVVIRAPMLGTFYRAPAPGEKPFVEVGQRVRADDTVCLIEVMKLFNSIRAGVDGQVVDILVENGGLVEFNQPLIFVAPSKKA
jgi:acetyl-CoA carboxylase biotin carboxyl carrier protein